MKKYKASMILVILLSPIYDSVAANDIPAYAMEMNVKRINGLLFRYTRFNAESPFPCLRLELIKPQDSWKVLEKKDICEMNGMSLASDFSYSGFEAIEFNNNAIDFKFSYFAKNAPGEYVQDCSIHVFENKIQDVKCTSPKLVE